MVFWVIAKRTSKYYLGLNNGRPELFPSITHVDVIKFKLKYKAEDYFSNQFQGDKNIYYVLRAEIKDGQVRQTKTKDKRKRKNKSK